MQSFPQILYPVLKNRFMLSEWGVSRAVSNTLALQLISMTINHQAQSHRNRNKSKLTFIFDDDAEGRTTNAITYLNEMTNLVRVSILNGDAEAYSYFNFRNVKIENIEYSLDYAESGIAKYVVTCTYEKMSRTID